MTQEPQPEAVTPASTTEQPEALRLAEVFEGFKKSSPRWTDGQPIHLRVAQELRDQHARIAALEAQLTAQRAPLPSDWKAAPIHPTPEMIEAAAEAHMPFGDMALAVQMAILVAPQPPGAAQARTPLTDAQCDSLIAALCPDFSDTRFPGDRPIMRQLARDAFAACT